MILNNAYWIILNIVSEQWSICGSNSIANILNDIWLYLIWKYMILAYQFTSISLYSFYSTIEYKVLILTGTQQLHRMINPLEFHASHCGTGAENIDYEILPTYVWDATHYIWIVILPRTLSIKPIRISWFSLVGFVETSLGQLKETNRVSTTMPWCTLWRCAKPPWSVKKFPTDPERNISPENLNNFN